MRLSKLKLDKEFRPCSAEAGDELFPNGIFEFNISRLLSFIQAHADRFPVEPVELTDIPDYGDAGLGEKAICTADLSRPILLPKSPPDATT